MSSNAATMNCDPFGTEEYRMYPGILIAVDQDGFGWILNVPRELILLDFLENTSTQDSMISGVPKHLGVHEGVLHAETIPPDDYRVWFEPIRTVWSRHDNTKTTPGPARRQ